jgi:Putative prokaryotic signal transducing protein
MDTLVRIQPPPMICLQVVRDRTKAELIRAHLESAGIECQLRADDAGGTMPHLTLAFGVEIRVREEDRALATEILESHPSAP